jgi:hypothetical protein
VAQLTQQGIALGNAFNNLLVAEDIVPGDSAGYELCKLIYLYHPHGSKIVDRPLTLATSKPRNLTVPGAAGDGTDLIEAFEKQWKLDGCNEHLLNVGRLARIYGPASIGIIIEGDEPNEPLDFKKLSKATMSYSEWDPLNTAGSLVFNQDPNSLDFQKTSGVRVNGKAYDRTRVVVIQHENPLYIAYESAGFGYTGRSAYQRALVPLKQFIHLMMANGMVALKAGVLIAKIDQPSSAIDRVMSGFLGQKRSMVKEAQTGNVISISTDEDIETLNLQNVDGAINAVRKNIIEDMAAGAGMPAKLLLEDTFAVGFGEGTEDSKAIAQYLMTVRDWLNPIYDFLDRCTMYRAWNEDFFNAIREKFPEQYGNVPYDVAFADWQNSFHAEWPNLLEETDEEKATSEKVTLEAVTSVFTILAPELPPTEKAKLIDWVMNNLNAKTHLFSSPLELDIMAIADFAEETAAKAEAAEAAKAEALAAGNAQDDSEDGEDDGPGERPEVQEPKPPAPNKLPKL